MSGDGIARDGIRAGDVVVVTGAGGGFGRAFCRRFAHDGAKVAAWDIDARLGEDIVREVKAAGGEARFVKVDLSQPAEIDAAVAATLAAYGTPYCVINNASIFPRASVLDMAPEVWERTFRVNITAPWLIAKGFGARMIANKRGVIINIASGRALEAAGNG